MKKQFLFLLLLGLLCSIGNVWADVHKIWNLQKNYSTDSESGLTTNNTYWKFSSSVYTYQKALSNGGLKKADGSNFELTEGLTFTCASTKLKLGKGYLAMDDTGEHEVLIPTAANQYVNLVVGVGTANKTITVTGGDISSFTIPFSTKAFSINIKASGTSLKISTPSSDGFKLYIYQIAVIDDEDVVAPVITSPEPGSYYKGFSISLSCETEDVTIKFKQESSAKGFADLGEYSSAFACSSGNRIVSTCATKEITQGTLYSDMIAYNFTRVDDIPTPVATPAAGTYNTTQNVELSAEGLLPNGVIRYTTDGTTPSKSSAEYTSPIEVSTTTTIKAYVFDASGSNKGSTMLTAAYTIVEPVDPVFSITATTIPSNSSAQIKVGSNDGLDGVTLSNISYGNPGVVTVNASTGVVTPVAAGTTTITFDTEETLMYNASTSNEFTVTVVDPKCATPEITPSSFVSASQEISIACATDGATIHYTLDGSTPTALSYTYDPENKPVISSTTTIKAIAVTGGYVDSDVASATIKKFIPGTWGSWDFTNWSSATQTGVLGDATNWHNKEKASGGLDFTEENQLGRSSNISLSNSTLKYETTTIPETDGIKFTASTDDNKRVCLMFNLPSTTLGTYHGSKFIWLQSSSAKITIPSVPAGAIVEIGVESHNATDARYLTLSGVDGISQTQGASSGDAAKVYQICKWSIPSTGNIVLTPNKGLHIYYITVTANVETVPVTKRNDRTYGTFVAPCGLDFSGVANMEAYIAKAINGTTSVSISKVTKVPAGTAFIVKTADDPTVDLANVPVTTFATASDVEGNLLVAGDGETAWNGTAGYTYYYLASDAFHKATSGTLQSGKAYLKVEGDPALAPSLRIFEGEQNATDIQSIESADKTVKFIENGRILILRDGITYDALGRIVK